MRVTIENGHVLDKDFKQTGYKVTYESSEKFNAMLNLPSQDSAQEKIRILDGKRHFCVEKAGNWTITPAADCFKPAQDLYTIDTRGPVHIDFTPKAYKLSGQFKLASEEEIGFYVDGEESKDVDIEFEDYSIWIPKDLA